MIFRSLAGEVVANRHDRAWLVRARFARLRQLLNEHRQVKRDSRDAWLCSGAWRPSSTGISSVDNCQAFANYLQETVRLSSRHPSSTLPPSA